HHGGGAVVDAGGVAGGDGAVLPEGGTQLVHVLNLRSHAHVLVLGEDGGALAGLQLDGQDLGLEPLLVDGPFGAVVALHRQGILVRAADAPLFGDVLGGDAHVVVPKGAGQGAGHRIHHGAVTHALAETSAGQPVGGAAH